MFIYINNMNDNDININIDIDIDSRIARSLFSMRAQEGQKQKKQRSNIIVISQYLLL